MGNPFFNQNAQNQQPMGNPNMLQQFIQFRNNFRGDPKQKVQELLNSGQMSQQQFNQLSQLAFMFQNMFKR